MGRPAFSWRVTPGDHGTEGSEDPPTMVTAPSGAIPKQLARQIAVTPRGFVGPTLSRSSRRQHDRMKDCQTNIPRQRSRHQTKHKGGVDQNIDHTHYQCRGPLPGGGRRGRGRTQFPPPCLPARGSCSEFWATISSQSQVAKNCAVSAHLGTPTPGKHWISLSTNLRWRRPVPANALAIHEAVNSEHLLWDPC